MQLYAMWQPITLLKLYDYIFASEKDMRGEIYNFWQMIQIEPEKWQEKHYGNSDGFWVVALCGKRVIWYNDIEEGFNISKYKNLGVIDEYYCNQDNLKEAVISLFSLVKFGGEVSGQASPPISFY